MKYKKVKVLYLCGHSENVILYQSERTISNKIAKMGKSFCNTCKAKEQIIDHFHNNMQKAVELGIPKLCGSYDQIILANQIRMKFIEEYIIIKEKDLRRNFKRYCKVDKYNINEIKIDINEEGNLKKLINFIIYNITDAKVWEESINDYNNLLYIGGLSFNNW